MFANGKPTLDVADLKAAVRQLGMKLTADEVAAMIEEADGNGRGKIDFTEFCSMMAERTNGLDSDTLLHAFECFDTTSSGTISHDEMRRILSELGPCKFTDKEVPRSMLASKHARSLACS